MNRPWLLPNKRVRPRSGIERAPQRIWPRHRRFVRGHACCVPGCAAMEVDFAHLRSAANAGKDLKPMSAALSRAETRERTMAKITTEIVEPVPVAPAALQFTVDQVVALYQKTRAEIDVLAAAHQKTLDPLNARVDLCKAWLLKYLTDQKLENARTEHGLIYKSQVMSATVDPDGGWEQLFGYILEAVLERALDAVERNASDEDILAAAMQAPTLALLNHAVNKTAVKELLEQQIVVPGVKIAHVVQLGVRKS